MMPRTKKSRFGVVGASEEHGGEGLVLLWCSGYNARGLRLLGCLSDMVKEIWQPCGKYRFQPVGVVMVNSK